MVTIAPRAATRERNWATQSPVLLHVLINNLRPSCSSFNVHRWGLASLLTWQGWDFHPCRLRPLSCKKCPCGRGLSRVRVRPKTYQTRVATVLLSLSALVKGPKTYRPHWHTSPLSWSIVTRRTEPEKTHNISDQFVLFKICFKCQKK